MTDHKNEVLEVIEDAVFNLINADLNIKAKHGFIYEVRFINLGDSTVFERDGGSFIVETNTVSVNVEDILSTDKSLLEKADEISFKLIDRIDNDIKSLIEVSGVSAKLKSFKGAVKVVIDSSLIIVRDGNVMTRYGVALLY